MPTTVGHFLLNTALPPQLKITGPITNKQLHDHVVDLAKSDPVQYVEAISMLKRRGDEIATLEGISVGLDDITPHYEVRNNILKPALAQLTKPLSAAEREKIVVQTQQQLLDHTKTHPGSMTHMATSGARGNVGQLMKIVATPLATVDPKKGLSHLPIQNSYAEGLTPAEYWATVPEVRANEVQARISVSEPGEMAKVLVSNMINLIVTVTDCGTNNGIMMDTTDHHILGRFAQAQEHIARNTLVTPQLLQQYHTTKTLKVRSPITCIAQKGVCQYCQGHNEKGQLHRIGTPVGVRSAQALAEPLTQMALSARHGTLTVKETKLEPTGLKGVRQYLEAPKAFRFEAALAPKTGTVTKIEKAPQGGHYIHVDTHKLYVRPELDVLVKEQQRVEYGDALTNGVPHPTKLVEAKGIGAGRDYFIKALHRVYKNEGLDLDRRHLELLAKSELNHVRLLDHDPNHPELLKGDVVNYNTFRETYGKEGTEKKPIDQAVNQRLGQEVLHYTVGTLLTPSTVDALKRHGIKEVVVHSHMPAVEFVMRPFTINPLLEQDWMARLAHRQLQSSIHQAVHFGETSDIHGTHPVPAYAFGAQLQHGPSGHF